jgi:uncharacterized repeat protein (TIGR03847 family)
MDAESFRYEQVQHFTAGTVGPKGQRTFFLQFGNPGDLVSLKLEKTQVAALAEFFDRLLEDLDPLAPDEVPLALDLIEPVQAAWVVSSIGVAHEPDDGLFVMVVEQLVEDEDDEPASAELRITQGQVHAFIVRARDLVSSGRPPCEFCGRPLDHDDGWCPCHN